MTPKAELALAIATVALPIAMIFGLNVAGKRQEREELRKFVECMQSADVTTQQWYSVTCNERARL